MNSFDDLDATTWDDEILASLSNTKKAGGPTPLEVVMKVIPRDDLGYPTINTEGLSFHVY